MIELLNSSLLAVTKGYYIRQVIVITALFVTGLVWTGPRGSSNKKLCVRNISLAFPVGLALFSMWGLFLLITGIPFNALTVSILTVLSCVMPLILYRDRINIKKTDIRLLVLTLIGAFFLALLACSSTLSVTIDNDSVYYYSTYPSILVKEGRYYKYFDTFLTDVGQSSAVINTLPFLYGFDNTFGIQHFMNISFLVFFGDSIFRMLKNRGSEKREALICAITAALFLLTSAPFIFIAKWVMSNVYFMEYLFITFILGIQMSKDRDELPEYISFVLMFTLSMLRVEAAVIAAVMVICLSFTEIKKRTIVLCFMVPLFLTQCAYYLALYLRMGVDPLYSFLDIKKALVVILALGMVLIYLLFVRDTISKNEKLKGYLPVMLILILLMGNLAAFVINRERYLNNLNTFYLNIRLQNGWGYFGFMMFIAGMAGVIYIIGKKLIITDVFVVFYYAYMLTIIVSCWARGGMLRMGVGDSGNRMLLSTVPFTVMLIVKALAALRRKS
ncbi:MAG: hypothetical protein K6F99_02990 [Lachnospiraceae bacterium]|nr:hypothetical protein [Lachnospiraceae bacterium]